MSNECRIDGCNKPPPYVRELCQMHYTRWKRGVDLEKQEERRGLCLSERLWQYIDVGDFEECWEWTGYRSRQGYGQFVLYPPDVPQKRTVLAHRLAWEMFWRLPLQDIACHHVGPGCGCGGDCIRCNNPSCCSPLHIYDGTTSSNAQDSVAVGTCYVLRPGSNRAVGEATGLAKLTDQAVREIRQRYAEGGISQQQLANEYGVHQTKISNVVNRKTWCHVE